MKVLFVGAVPITGGGVAPDTMEAHVHATLRRLGAEVEYFPYLTWGGGYWLNRCFERARTDLRWIDRTPVDRALSRKARTLKPDLVLTLLGNYLPPATVDLLREVTTARFVCWCQDHMGTMGRQYLIGSRYDHVFAKDAALVDKLRRYTSIDAHYLAEACNPDVHRRLNLDPAALRRYACEVATAATTYYFRAEILEALADRDLKIWGALPPYYRGSMRIRHAGSGVFAADKAACFSAARIVLNSLHPMESGGLNARAFEVAGCGAFQLISASDAIVRHFVPGAEIETFADLAELREKVNYYLAHDGEREKIANAGQARAYAEHTYAHRLTELMACVFPDWRPV